MLDDGLSRALREAFVRLYEKGSIHPVPVVDQLVAGFEETAVSISKWNTAKKRLRDFKYMLKGSNEFIRVATSVPRPSSAITLWLCIRR